ncbi:DUF5916 domain-containing protein [Gemmatimonadota bacterium]
MAQSESVAIPLPRLTGPITLDGVGDEAAWAEIPVLTMTQHEPIFGAEPTERSVIRVAYDREYLYVGAYLYDREPDRIQATTLYRDGGARDDHILLLLDSFNDNENGRFFATTPTGTRNDGLVFNDGSGMDGSWNTFWDVATARSSEGWSAEIRIPFSSLGFEADEGIVEMGLVVERYIVRKNERATYPAISNDFSYLRPSLAQDVTLESIESSRPLYATPYVLGGSGRSAVFDALTNGYIYDTEKPAEIGADLRYNVTNNLALDLTVNTDFAQVEADDQQVNLSRFSLFFPEKRQFFLDHADIFNFSTGGRSRLFHSRQIGLVGGSSVRILAGGRMVGRTGPWDLGFLSMQTDDTDGLPSENFGLLRVRRQVLNPYSNAGAILVSRIGGDGSYNVAYGLDTRLRIRGDDYLTFRWAQTFDDEVADDVGFRFSESALVQVAAQRIRQEGLVYGLSGRWAGEDYRPDVGFRDRHDFTELNYSIAYLHLMSEESRFQRIDPFQVFGYVVFRNEDRSVESAQIEYDTDLHWKSGGSVWLDAEVYYEDLPNQLNFPENTHVPAGRYWFFRTEGGYNFPPGRLLRASINGGAQQFYDGWLANVGVYPEWRASPHFQVGASYNFVAVRFPDRDQEFDSHLVQVRTQAALNTKLSVNAFVQLSSVADLTAANVRLRYNFREGQDLWLVWNQGWNMDRFDSSPVLPRTDNRTILVKYTHTLGR